MAKTGADVLVESSSTTASAHFRHAGLALDDDLRRDRARPARSRTILIRNEQAGAFAADGYARVTGRARRRLHHGRARRDQRPDGRRRVLGRLGPDPPARRPGQRRRRSIASAATTTRSTSKAIFRPVTQWCGTRPPGRPDPGAGRPGLPGDDRAAGPGPPRSFLPQDLMRAACPDSPRSPALPPPPDARRARSTRSPRPPSSWPGRAPDHPGRRRRPLVGRGRARSRPSPRRLGAPVITTLNGKGLIDERDPLSLGHARSVRAKAVLPHADAMLAVGCRFTEVMTDWRRMPVPGRPRPDRPRSRARSA